MFHLSCTSCHIFMVEVQLLTTPVPDVRKEKEKKYFVHSQDWAYINITSKLFTAILRAPSAREKKTANIFFIIIVSTIMRLFYYGSSDSPFHVEERRVIKQRRYFSFTNNRRSRLDAIKRKKNSSAYLHRFARD